MMIIWWIHRKDDKPPEVSVARGYHQLVAGPTGPGVEQEKNKSDNVNVYTSFPVSCTEVGCLYRHEVSGR